MRPSQPRLKTPPEKPTGELVDWLVLDLNSFFASCEQQDNPALRGKPVGVVPMENVDTTCLLAASYEAKRLGLGTGSPVHEAKRVCPNIVLVPATHRRYVGYHTRILEVIENCTPIERVMSIDEVACRLTGSQREPANAMALGRQIKHAIRTQVGDCLTSSVGISANILLAKLASNMQKPDGLTIVRPCDLPHRLVHLSLRDFSGIGPRTEKRLNQAGIFSVADLYQCERKHLRAIWGGVEGERYYAQIWGYNVNRSPSHKSVIGHQHVLEPNLRNGKGAHDVLHHLLIKAAVRLRQAGYYCKRLSVQIKLDRHMGYWENHMTFTETQDTRFLLQRMNEIWNEFDQRRPLRVGVALHGLVHESDHQGDLFSKPKPTQLFKAMDDLNEKFGRHTITFGLNDYVQSRTAKDKIAFQRVPDISEVT